MSIFLVICLLTLGIFILAGAFLAIDLCFIEKKVSSGKVINKIFQPGFMTLFGYHSSQCSIEIEIFGKRVWLKGLPKGANWAIVVGQEIAAGYIRGRLSGHIYIRKVYW